MEIKNPYGFIYITTNVINGKRYIGQKKFCYDWQTYLGSGTLFRKALNKYGKENFKRDIVAIAYTKEELNKLEIQFIKNHNANDRNKYYNITKGGDGGNGLCGELNGMYGKHLSEKHKERLRIANSGENNSFYGKHHSEETKKKISQANKGKNVGGKSVFAKKVICIDTGEIFDSASEVERKYNYPCRTISACCRNEKRTAYGKVWMYLEKYNNTSKEEVKILYARNKKGIKGEYNPKAREIICLNTLERFKTLTEASEEYSIGCSLISACCSKKHKSVTSKEHDKLVFRYYEDYLKMTEQEIKDDIFYGKYSCESKDKIICLDTSKIYYCARQVEEETGLFATSITACCKGRYKTVGKLHWQYYNEYIKLSGGESVDKNN